MQPMSILVGIIGILIFIIFLVLVSRWKKILSNFRPDLFQEIIMISKTNDVLIWLNFNPKRQPFFEENKIKYFFSEKTIYMGGKVRSFVFNEGNPNPLDLRTMSYKSNPQLEQNLKDLEIMELFTSVNKNPLMKTLQEYQPLIIIVGLIILGLIILKDQSGV